MTGEQWLETLERIEQGDRVALARVTALVTGYLARFRAWTGRQDSPLNPPPAGARGCE